MARTKGSVGADTQKAIIAAAKRLIVERGFEAMTLRQLAAEVGVQAGSVYRYIASKDQLLSDLMSDHMDSLLAAWNECCVPDADPETRLRAFVAFHIRYHVERRQDVFIANMELRALKEPARTRVVAKRRHYEQALEDILKSGIQSGVFPENDVEVSAFAILAMLTGVCFWYRKGGRLDVEQIIAVHEELVLNGVRTNAAPLSSIALSA